MAVRGGPRLPLCPGLMTNSGVSGSSPAPAGLLFLQGASSLLTLSPNALTLSRAWCFVLCARVGEGAGLPLGALQCLLHSVSQVLGQEDQIFGSWPCVSRLWAEKQSQAFDLDRSCAFSQSPLASGTQTGRGGRGSEVPEAPAGGAPSLAWGRALWPSCPPGVT